MSGCRGDVQKSSARSIDSGYITRRSTDDSSVEDSDNAQICVLDVQRLWKPLKFYLHSSY